MSDYQFVSHWRLEAPVQAVWDAIYDVGTWPSWWRDVLRVEDIEKGDDQGIGAVRRMTWKTALPYSFTFDTRSTIVQEPNVIESLAFGDLEGMGHWELKQLDDGTTDARYDWNVRTNKAWMNLLAPLLRPAFAWNHATVMRRGADDLARHLGVNLVYAT
jgi:Polyketide cyclase / dehydrase and lipid transport